MDLRSSAALLDIILAGLNITPRDGNDAFIVEGRDEIIPFGYLHDARVVCFLRAREHVALDGLEEF